MANELKMQIAVKLIEAQKRVKTHDVEEASRRKHAGENRKQLLNKVNELTQMYESGVVQEELPGVEEV